MNAIGQCLRHPESTATFRCRQCNDPVCIRCRAQGDKDLCDTCGKYREEVDRIEAQGGIDALLAKRRRRPWGRRLIAVLVVLNLATLGVYLLYPWPRPVIAADVLATAAALSGLVQESRDSTGRYPENLEGLRDRLPVDAAELLRRGVITYRTPADRWEYEVEIAPTPLTPAP